MFRLFIFGFCSFCFSVVLTPICRDLFRHFGILDRPDEFRKTHATPVPHMGGVPLLLSYVITCLLMLLFPSRIRLWEPFNFSVLLWAAPAAGIIFITGILDDLFRLRPFEKLSGQFIAAIWAYYVGIRISLIAYHPIPQWAGAVLTV